MVGDSERPIHLCCSSYVGESTGLEVEEHRLERSAIRVLVTDDNLAWRRFVCSTLQKSGLQVVGEVGNGLDAVRKAEELNPDC